MYHERGGGSTRARESRAADSRSFRRRESCSSRAGRRPSRTSPTRRSFPARPPTVTSHPKSISSSMSCSSARSTKSTTRSPPPLAQPTPPLASRTLLRDPGRRSPRTGRVPQVAAALDRAVRFGPCRRWRASAAAPAFNGSRQALEPIASRSIWIAPPASTARLRSASAQRRSSSSVTCAASRPRRPTASPLGALLQRGEESEAQRGKPRGTKWTTADT